MAFEVVQNIRKRTGHLPGECRMGKNGTTSFHVEDLESVGIQDKATILIDRETLQVALRLPAEHEPSVNVAKANKGCKSTRNISTRFATNALNLPYPAAALKLAVDRRGAMLVVQLVREDFAPSNEPLAVNDKPATPKPAQAARAKAADGPHPTKAEVPFANLRPPSTTARKRDF